MPLVTCENPYCQQTYHVHPYKLRTPAKRYCCRACKDWHHPYSPEHQKLLTEHLAAVRAAVRRKYAHYASDIDDIVSEGVLRMLQVLPKAAAKPPEAQRAYLIKSAFGGAQNYVESRMLLIPVPLEHHKAGERIRIISIHNLDIKRARPKKALSGRRPSRYHGATLSCAAGRPHDRTRSRSALPRMAGAPGTPGLERPHPLCAPLGNRGRRPRAV